MITCPCCGTIANEFTTYGLKPRPNAMCPTCGALERHRLMWLFFERRTNLLRQTRRILHIAPEAPIAAKLRTLSGAVYVSGDLSSNAGMRLDITRLPFADGAFDVVLCSHVLEHIPDDGAAMKELRRVMSADGWGVLQVPISPRAHTFEDFSITDRRERERVFGQCDHVRVYGRDYGDRLRAAGFAVEVVPFGNELGAAARSAYALLPEDIYLCRPAA
jgi:SAM-dependent methyltransferase